MSAARTALVTAAAFVALAGCGAQPYYGTAALSQQAGDPSAQIDPNVGIRMAEGSAASAHIEFDSQTGGTLVGDLQSQDPSILTILHAPHDGSTYVFLAKKPGLAEVFVLTDGVAVRSLNAVVTAPSSLGDAGADAGPDAEADGGEAGADLDASDGSSDAADGGD